MNRTEFILRLEQALRGMPEEERRRAVEYYENYFDEAGPENEAEVLRTLGAPEKVAADILKEFYDAGTTGAADGTKAGRSASRMKKNFRSMDNGQKLLMIALAAVALVCIVPACVAVIGGLGGVLLALICVIIAIFLIVPSLAIAAWGCAVGFAIAAVVHVAVNPPLALLFAGIALICMAVGILLWRLTVYLFRITFPALLNGIAGLFRRMFHPRG